MSAGQPAGAQPAAPPHAERLRAAGALALPPEVTFATARAALAQALPALDAARPLFDLSACRHFDSSLIGVLLELSRRASAAGRRCTFVGASPNLHKLSGLYGVEHMLFDERDAQGLPATSHGR